MDLLSLQKTAITAALAAGGKILEVYESDDFDVSLKSDDSPLTKADLLSHNTITAILEKGTPDLPILGEEGREIPFDVRGKWDSFWLVDPLDGTKEFIKKNGEFTVNIALVEQNFPVLGVLYVPVRNILYFAAAGHGAYKAVGADEVGFTESPSNNQRLPLPSERKIPPVKVVASRSHFSPETSDYVDEIRDGYGEVDLVNAGSSLKICLVAEGTADVYPRFGPTMEWDVAAGQAIAEEAGCTVKNAGTGERLRYNKQDLLNPYFIVEKAGWKS